MNVKKTKNSKKIVLKITMSMTVFYEGQVVTSILTPPGYPCDLSLNGLELILNNVRNVVTFLLKVFSNPIPSK